MLGAGIKHVAVANGTWVAALMEWRLGGGLVACAQLMQVPQCLRIDWSSCHGCPQLNGRLPGCKSCREQQPQRPRRPLRTAAAIAHLWQRVPHPSGFSPYVQSDWSCCGAVYSQARSQVQRCCCNGSSQQALLIRRPSCSRQGLKMASSIHATRAQQRSPSPDPRAAAMGLMRGCSASHIARKAQHAFLASKARKPRGGCTSPIARQQRAHAKREKQVGQAGAQFFCTPLMNDEHTHSATEGDTHTGRVHHKREVALDQPHAQSKFVLRQVSSTRQCTLRALRVLRCCWHGTCQARNYQKRSGALYMHASPSCTHSASQCLSVRSIRPSGRAGTICICNVPWRP